MSLESLFFPCFGHFSLFVWNILRNSLRVFPIDFLCELLSRYEGKTIHDFLLLLFIEFDFSTTCPRTLFVYSASESSLIDCFSLVVKASFGSFV